MRDFKMYIIPTIIGAWLPVIFFEAGNATIAVTITLFSLVLGFTKQMDWY